MLVYTTLHTRNTGYKFCATQVDVCDCMHHKNPLHTAGLAQQLTQKADTPLFTSNNVVCM